MVYPPRMADRLGRYEVIRPIASGGMATVYLARSTAVGGFERLVAIKLMHPHIANEPDFCAMFLDEARLAARIRHPNVVGTHDVQQGEGGLFLVMDYIEGPPLVLLLRTVARNEDQVPLDIALRIFLDALAGLHAAHELRANDGTPLNLVHRDVSPQNLLVGEDGVTRITDFGVAHAEARLSTTRGRSVKGKIAYLSPEQIETGKVDRRSDVYAAGIVLWEMLTLKRLFKQDNEGMTLAKILQGDKPSPLEFRQDLPPSVVAAVMRALERSPDARFASASEFADGLEAAASAAGIRIASTRAVSAFVRALGVDYSAKAPLRLPPSEPSAAKTLARGASFSSHEASNTNASAVLGSSDAPLRRWRAGLVGLVVLGAVSGAVGLGAWLVLRRSAATPAAAPEASSALRTDNSVATAGAGHLATHRAASAPSTVPSAAVADAAPPLATASPAAHKSKPRHAAVKHRSRHATSRRYHPETL